MFGLVRKMVDIVAIGGMQKKTFKGANMDTFVWVLLSNWSFANGRTTPNGIALSVTAVVLWLVIGCFAASYSRYHEYMHHEKLHLASPPSPSQSITLPLPIRSPKFLFEWWTVFFSHTDQSPFKFVPLCPLLPFSQRDLINLSNAPLSQLQRVIWIVRMIRRNSIITRRETTHKRGSCQSFSVKLFTVVQLFPWISFEKTG